MSTRAVARATRPNFLVLAALCALLGIALAARQPVSLALHEILLVLDDGHHRPEGGGIGRERR